MLYPLECVLLGQHSFPLHPGPLIPFPGLTRLQMVGKRLKSQNGEPHGLVAFPGARRRVWALPRMSVGWNLSWLSPASD